MKKNEKKKLPEVPLTEIHTMEQNKLQRIDKPKLFEYDNYRNFIGDCFKYRKKNSRGFSLKTFSDKAGFKARDFILRVIQGKRNLSIESSESVASALDLSEKESAYFTALVRLNQAKNPKEIEQHLQKLNVISKQSRFQQLRNDQFEYLSEWYHSALRSLLPVTYYKEDYAGMAKRLDPEISALEAKESVQLLMRLGLLTRSSWGKYQVENLSLTTGDELRLSALAKFHCKTMELAKRSIENHSFDERDISGLTLSVSPQTFQRLKKEVQQFRKHLLSIAEQDSGEDRVVQINFHLFPLSKSVTIKNSDKA